MPRKPPTKANLQRDLRAARILLDEQSTKINSLNVTIGQQASEFSRVCQRLRNCDLEIARLNGYIDRVREVEGRPTYEVGVATDGTMDRIADDMDYNRG